MTPADYRAIREALDAMLSYTADLNPNQGFDEYDHDAIKQAAAALAALEKYKPKE